MNKYRVEIPVLVNGEFTQGDEFDYEFTVDEELTNVQSGLLSIVPRKYRVIGGSEVYGTKATDEDPTFEAAMFIENEAALIQGGHIVRVEDTPVKKSAKKEEAK